LEEAVIVGLLEDFRDGEFVGLTVGFTELGDLVGAMEDLNDGETDFEKLGIAEDGVKEFDGNTDGDFVGDNVGPNVGLWVGLVVVGRCVGLEVVGS